MPSLLAYDASGAIVATLDQVVVRDELGVALVDVEAHEAAGGQLTDIWRSSDAVGSGTWPEHLGARARDFRVELDGKRIAALVHRQSGHRRERSAIAQAIADAGENIRAVVGGPDRPLPLDDAGRTMVRSAPVRPTLPLIGLLRRD